MRIFRHTDKTFTKDLAALQRRAEPAPEVESVVREIIAAIRTRGDRALLEYTAKFGGPTLKATQLRETREAQVEPATADAVAVAHRNVREFALRSLRKDWSMKNAQGALVGERF